MLYKRLSKLLGRLGHRQLQEKNTSPVSMPDQPFYHFQQIADVHDFYYNFNLATDPFLKSDGPLQGYCYICDQRVSFEVDRPADGSPVNWRETLKCPGCEMINRWRGCIHLFEAECRPSSENRIYITEALSPVFSHLSAKFPNLISSEYFPDEKRGDQVIAHSHSIRNEDVTQLTFPDKSFDSILCFDVLEHVPNYRVVIAEFQRVLDHNGHLILTAPFSFQQETVVRAIVNPNGDIEHLMEPCYHGDPLSADGVLAFYDFGMELLDELEASGFKENYLVCYNSNEWGYSGANIAFVSRK